MAGEGEDDQYDELQAQNAAEASGTPYVNPDTASGGSGEPTAAPDQPVPEETKVPQPTDQEKPKDPPPDVITGASPSVPSPKPPDAGTPDAGSKGKGKGKGKSTGDDGTDDS